MTGNQKRDVIIDALVCAINSKDNENVILQSEIDALRAKIKDMEKSAAEHIAEGTGVLCKKRIEIREGAGE